MKHILLIESSPRGSDSYSHQAARSIVNEILTRNKALAAAQAQSKQLLAQAA